VKTKYSFFLKLIGSLFALALLAAPSVGMAAATISSVRVVITNQTPTGITSQEYCSNSVPGCTYVIWNLPAAGITLNPGETFILTQTGLTTPVGMLGGENFDSSERAGQNTNGVIQEVGCSNAGSTPCTTDIYINGVLVYHNTTGAGNPLVGFNLEPFSDVSNPNAVFFQEDEPWVTATPFTGPSTYKLELGYADNIHGGACLGGATGCFPQANWCSFPLLPASATGVPTNTCPLAATWFVGAGIAPIGNCGMVSYPTGTTHTTKDAAGNEVGCYDAGALRITALANPHLKVVKTPDVVLPATNFTSGGPVSFTIVVSNDGDAGSVATNVALSDQLPTNGGLNWSGATVTASQGTCGVSATSLLTCTLGSITAPNSVTITVSLASTPAAACTSQPNPAANATADGGLTATDSGSLNCIPAPHLKVVKTPDVVPPATNFTQGGPVSFTIVVSNDGQAGSVATNVALSDQLPTNGGLNWSGATLTTSQGSCSVSATSLLTCSLGSITAPNSVTITVSLASTPAAACTDQPNPAANATANGGLTATDSGRLNCIPPPPPGGLIAPTQTTCSDFRDGTASALDGINYPVSGGKIGQGINPGVFFYYTKITTTVPNQVVTVTESQNDAAALFQTHSDGRLYTLACTSWTAGTDINNDTGATFTVPTPGTYIISVKYDTKSIAGTTAPTSDPVTYTFTTSLGGATSASVLLNKK